MIKPLNDNDDPQQSGSIVVPAILLLLVINCGNQRNTSLRADPPTGQIAPPEVVATDGRTMQVVVLGPDGKPLAGAKVHASIWSKDPVKSNQKLVCDQQGRVTVELPHKIDILRLWASYDGYVPLFANWWPEHERNPRKFPDKYTFRLQRGTTIGGVVKNGDGESIAGVKVAVMLINPQGEKDLDRQAIPSVWLAEGEDRKITDAEGRWSLDNAPAGEEFGFSLMLEHPDYVSDNSWGGLQRKQDVGAHLIRNQTATVVMPRGARISGSIKDPNGNAITDGLVIWGDDPYGQQGSQEVRLDDQGNYKLPPLPVGLLNVTVVAPGWAPDQQSVDLTNKGTKADFVLKPGKRLRITFMDGAKTPIPNVSVGIESWRGGKALYNHRHPNVLDTKIPVTSDKEGIYEWTWAPDDEAAFTFYKDGFRHNREVTLTAGGDETEYEFTLQR